MLLNPRFKAVGSPYIDRFILVIEYDNLTHEDKRLAIKALDIKVWIKHDELIMEGSIPMPDDLSNLTVTSSCSE